MNNELEDIKKLKTSLMKKLSRAENENYFKKFKTMKESLEDVSYYIKKRMDVLNENNG